MADDDMADDDMADDMADDDRAADAPTGVAVPTAVSVGAFLSHDHTTTGEALLVLLPDGSYVVRFEGLATDNGPDLRVVLSPETAEVGYGPGSVELGRLQGNLGDQNYAVPAGLDLTQFRSVVIWCDRFSSAFGAAPIVAPTM